MGLTIKCAFAFSTSYRNDLTARLEGHAAEVEASYREGHASWLLALTILHEAVDAALDGNRAAADERLLAGATHLAACDARLTALAQSLVSLRSDLFERDDVDPAEPLLAREPFFATLDYDGLQRELAAQRAVLPRCVLWGEAAARVRDGGARSGCRLLERHLRELQSDLLAFVAEVTAARRLPLRAMADDLHGSSLAVLRVMTGYTRLITTFGYVSLFCERATRAYEERKERPHQLLASAAS